jgi:hypothetical protein
MTDSNGVELVRVSGDPRGWTGHTALTDPAAQLVTLVYEQLEKNPTSNPLLGYQTKPTRADLAVLAARMLSALPRNAETSELDARIGPFYRASDYATWQGISKQAVASRIASRALLAIKTIDGAVCLPSFQFDDRGTPLPRLAAVQRAFDPEADDAIGCALWLNRPAARFGDHTPAQLLRDGDSAPVLEVARQIGLAIAS